MALSSWEGHVQRGLDGPKGSRAPLTPGGKRRRKGPQGVDCDAPLNPAFLPSSTTLASLHSSRPIQLHRHSARILIAFPPQRLHVAPTTSSNSIKKSLAIPASRHLLPSPSTNAQWWQ
ncbi:hypothetical protein E2C01_075887 [Portunus trituberculatus]|uniref:Uncharacterized protein n=1 Tax=Portunus trituberculatus TaxID=210409 RepID=A0A5B7I9W5_PORTR|nr:hypothetical protein [Portunus trituberculatus]